MRLASAMGAPVYEVTRRDLDVATDGAVHQGVAIEVRGYEYADASDLIAGSLQQLGHPLLVALDQVTDPHNLGAVLRSAGAFGADGVIIPERRSAGVNTTAWKVSAGAAARGPVARATNLVPPRGRDRRRGCGPVPPRARDLRSDRVDPDRVDRRVPQRGRCHGHCPVRGGLPARAGLSLPDCLSSRRGCALAPAARQLFVA